MIMSRRSRNLVFVGCEDRIEHLFSSDNRLNLRRALRHNSVTRKPDTDLYFSGFPLMCLTNEFIIKK